MHTVALLILAVCLALPSYASQSVTTNDPNLLGALAFFCLLLSYLWFVVIGYFRHSMLAIGTLFFPFIGIIVVTVLEAKATIIPWALLVGSAVLMYLSTLF